MESTIKIGGLEKFQVTDREECGLIIERDEDGVIFRYVVRVPNHATEPGDYLILLHDLSAVERVLSENEQVIGFMHTHLAHHKCEPSDTDFEGAALFPEMEYLIYQPSTGDTCWYGPEVT